MLVQFQFFFHPFYEWENNSVSFLVNDMAAFSCVDNYTLVCIGILVPGSVSVFLLLSVSEDVVSTEVNVEQSS